MQGTWQLAKAVFTAIILAEILLKSKIQLKVIKT